MANKKITKNADGTFSVKYEVMITGTEEQVTEYADMYPGSANIAQAILEELEYFRCYSGRPFSNLRMSATVD